MKVRILIVLLMIPAVGYTSFVAAKHFWRGTTMAQKKVCETWGNQPYDKEKFKSGTQEVRSSMACWIISNQKKFIGKDRSEIRAELGDHTGFYFTDMFP